MTDKPQIPPWTHMARLRGSNGDWHRVAGVEGKSYEYHVSGMWQTVEMWPERYEFEPIAQSTPGPSDEAVKLLRELENASGYDDFNGSSPEWDEVRALLSRIDSAPADPFALSAEGFRKVEDAILSAPITADQRFVCLDCNQEVGPHTGWSCGTDGHSAFVKAHE